MARLSLPTSARLPSSIRVDPSNSAVTKALNRLSRPSLLSLVLDWLDEKNLPLCPPLLRRSAARGEDDENEDVEDDDDDDYEGDFYPPARSLPELRELYASMQAVEKKSGGSKREVVDRIVEGDWRHGLSLYQLAMADLQHLYEHPNSLKWTAFRVQRLQNPSSVAEEEEDDENDDDENVGRRRRRRRRRSGKHNKKSLAVPRFHPSTFLQNLQAEVPPDVKAHYNFDRPKDLPLLLLRVFVLDSPYSTSLAVANNRNRNRSRSGGIKGGAAGVTSFDAARTIYIAFPDASPHIYISAAATAQATTATTSTTTTTGDSRSLRGLVVDAIPKALSRPRERYTLVPSGLSTRNLSALLHTKGAGRTNAAGGGWSVYAATSLPSTTTTSITTTTDSKSAGVSESPLNPTLMLPTPPMSDTDSNTKDRTGQKRKLEEVAVEENPVEAQHQRAVKRAKTAAQARFGNSARVDDGKGVERLDVLIEDAFPSVSSSALDGDGDGEGEERVEEEEGEPAQNSGNPGAKGRRSNAADLRFSQQEREREQEQGTDAAADDSASDDESGEKKKWRPRVKLAFHGAHVFAGIRQLVEAGVVDPVRMPGWMTGEEGVSIATVRHGRVKGHRGAGL